MAIRYKAQLNMGNEALKTEPTITVNKDVRPIGYKPVLRWMHDECKIVPENVAEMVISDFFKAAVAYMSQGMSVYMKHRGNVMIRLYPQVRIKGKNITLKRAKQIDPTIMELTPDVVRRLIGRVGVEVTVHAEVNPKFTQLLHDYGFDTECTEVVMKDVVRRKKK